MKSIRIDKLDSGFVVIISNEDQHHGMFGLPMGKPPVMKAVSADELPTVVMKAVQDMIREQWGDEGRKDNIASLMGEKPPRSSKPELPRDSEPQRMKLGDLLAMIAFMDSVKKGEDEDDGSDGR